MKVVKFETLRGGRGAVARLVKARSTADRLEPLADRILGSVKQDSNQTYSAAAYKRVSRARPDRVSWVITLPPYLERLALRVEAKRGTMARAVGSVRQ